MRIPQLLKRSLVLVALLTGFYQIQAGPTTYVATIVEIEEGGAAPKLLFSELADLLPDVEMTMERDQDTYQFLLITSLTISAEQFVMLANSAGYELIAFEEQ